MATNITSLGFKRRLPGEQEDFASSAGNWDLLNRFLIRLANHHHGGGGPAFSAPLPPVAAETGSPGQLPAGRQVFYRCSTMTDGIESPASPSTFVTTSGSLTPPVFSADDVTVITSGGSLISGVYLYAITFWAGSPVNDTLAANPVTTQLQSIDGNEQQVSISLPPLPAGADGYNIYRRYPGSIETYQIASLAGPQPGPYVDSAGSEVVAPFVVLPTIDRSGYTRSIEISRPADIPSGATWLLYRSLNDSEWDNTLVATSASSSYLDHGAAAGYGSPIEDSVIPYSDPPAVQASEISETADTHTFAAPGPATVGPISEWVIPHERVLVSGAVVSVDVATAPSASPLIAELEIWHGLWESFAVLPLPVGEASAVIDLTSETLVFPANSRIRATIVAANAEANVAIDLRLWAKNDGATPDAWAAPVWP